MTFWRDGAPLSPTSILWRSGGMRGSVASKDSPFVVAVQGLALSPVTGTS